jgi:hypothetical protein
MRVVGIDPGMTGAATLLVSGGRSRLPTILTVDLPTKGCKEDKDIEIDPRGYRDLLRAWKPDYLYFENIHAFLGQGVVAAGKMMRAAGTLEGISACEVDSCILVTPERWKAKFNLLKAARKDASCVLMRRYYPGVGFYDRVGDHNRADSALIALYGADRVDMIKLKV